MTETQEKKDPRLIEAEITKVLAEAEKIKAESAILELDREIKAAEVLQKRFHAVAAEFGAEQMRIQTESAKRQERLNLVTNHHYHEYLFTDPVYDESVEHCLAQLAIWDRLDPECDMTVVMRSPGGSVIAGMHLFDEIDRYSLRGGGTHKTIGKIRGWAASMAGILIQAFDERLIGPQATLMIHEVSSWAQGKVKEIEDELKFLQQLSAKVANKFVERANEAKAANPHIAGITLSEFEDKWERREWYLNAKDTINYGFADRIG